MGKNLVETLMGAVVLVVAGMFLMFAYSTADIRPVHGYTLTAKFERIDGVRLGTDVKLSGIKIGTVSGQALDPESYQAVLTMTVDSAIKLPTDTVAQISSEGLLGGNFVQLVPGAEDKMLAPGGQIKFTQPPVNLTQMLGKFMFNSAESSQSGAPKN